MRVLNLGAGVQSTTVYLMAHCGEIQPYDYAIFADTGEEPAAVYRHLEWLRELGGAPILVRSAGRLGDDLVRGINSTGGRFAAIPAYVRSGERIGVGRRQCTREYKVAVIERTIRYELLGLKPRQRIPKGTMVVQAYGISMDEAARSRRIRGRIAKYSPWITPEFPLLDRRMTRADCVRWLRNRVPHEVPKSSCVFCPYKSNEQWRWLRDNDQEGWKRAVQIDEALRNGAVASRGMAGQQYVHRSAVPLAEADLEDSGKPGKPQFSFVLECAGMCGI